jgi:predicted DsbA family dithiol-disulfide isomerase
MKIEIWSDIMCPFCYIGKRNFEKALGQFNHTENLEIEWKSFQLRPDLVTNPTKSLNQELAESKGWSLEYTQQMSEHVTQMAADSGIAFHLDKAIMANTVKGHQLLHFAKEHGKQNQAKELLFKAYFTDGKNVDEPSVLLDIAKALDLNTEEISKIFEDGTYLNDI